MSIINSMAVVLCAAATMFTCGDLADMDEDELRALVQRARQVARRELEKDFSKARVDAIEQAVIDVLQGDAPRGVCWEDGLRTTFLATQSAEVRTAGIGHAPHDGLTCTDHFLAQGTGVTCVSANCSCHADGVLQGSDNYATTCAVASTSASETNLYTEAQASVYEPSLVPDGAMSAYAIVPTVLGTKHPGNMFNVTVLDDDTPLPQDASARLAVYDVNGQEATNALAQWKDNLRANVYDIDVVRGRNFNDVFFMQASLNKGIQTLGGTVAGQGFRRAYVVVEGVATIATQVLIAQKFGNDLAIVLGGPAQDAFNAAGRILSYIALNAAGDIISQQASKIFTQVLEIDGSYLIIISGGTCISDNPVLLRMGNTRTVHEATCLKN